MNAPHVELDCHFVRQQFQSGLISLSFLPSQTQLADIFTKSLPSPQHRLLLGKLGVISSPSNLRGGVDDESQSTSEQSSTKQRDVLRERGDEK